MIVTTTDSQQVWQSQDGQKTIWQVTLKGSEDSEFNLRTYSPKIAELGFCGDIESYVNKRGDRFARQKVKIPEQADTSYQRDASIRAQWAIGQAIALASATTEDKQKITMPLIEKYAKELFDTVSRVKGKPDTAAFRKSGEAFIEGYMDGKA